MILCILYLISLKKPKKPFQGLISYSNGEKYHNYISKCIASKALPITFCLEQ